MTRPALQTHRLHKRFGGITATQDVSIAIERGARHALIGPNGAGKTTLVNLLTGVLRANRGNDRARRRRHHFRRPASESAPRPRAHVPDQPALRAPDAAGNDFAGHRASRRRGREGLDAALAAIVRSSTQAATLLSQLHLSDVLQRKVGVLAHGKRRLLEIAIALASRPRVLLLDEPMAGVPAAESKEILETLAALPSDVTVLLIEHDMDLVFRFATRISVMVNGSLLVEGTNDEIARDPRVKDVYLGQARRA